MNHDSLRKEKMILAHDPVPGYRPLFAAIFALSCFYLGYIFISTL